LEVLQGDHLDEVNNGSRTNRNRHIHYLAEWLRELLMNLPAIQKPIPDIPMKYDNQTVAIKVNNFKDNMKLSRHVKRRLKSVRKIRNSGVIALGYIHTSRNLADPFTKEMGVRPTV
jgi:hypothetical protein